MAERTNGGSAFPNDGRWGNGHPEGGMTLRDYFAIHAPEPAKEEVLRIMEMEQRANPHNEPYHNKVRRRSELEIRAALRFAYADQLLAERQRN